MAAALLDLVHTDRLDAREIPVGHSPQHCMLYGAKHVPSGRVDGDCRIRPRQPLRPPGQERAVAFREVPLAGRPRHTLDGHATIWAVDPQHARCRREAEGRGESPRAPRRRVVPSAILAAAWAARAGAGGEIVTRAGREDLTRVFASPGMIAAAVILTATLSFVRAAEVPSAGKIPLVVITDLYHPHQDVGDNLDLISGFALSNLDLRAVCLDVTDHYRKKVSDHPRLWRDTSGPREPGLIPLAQLNYIFNRSVPYAAGPFTALKAPDDALRDAPGFQMTGVELLLRVLRESDRPVEVLITGSARIAAAAFNREPDLLRKKVKRLHLSAGASSREFLEWNVELDPHALICLLRSNLPIAIYPCATKDGPFAYGPHNTFWKLENLDFVGKMEPKLRRYMCYALARSNRADFLRAMDEDDPAVQPTLYNRAHNVWETAPWMAVAGLRLVRRADGHCRIVPDADVRTDDKVLPNDLKPCRVKVEPDGRFQFEIAPGPSNFTIIDRGDPKENEAALREALPDLYLSFRP
jgi:pyrimidine-specific ribonucleoside hydrolase